MLPAQTGQPCPDPLQCTCRSAAQAQGTCVQVSVHSYVSGHVIVQANRSALSRPTSVYFPFSSSGTCVVCELCAVMCELTCMSMHRVSMRQLGCCQIISQCITLRMTSEKQCTLTLKHHHTHTWHHPPPHDQIHPLLCTARNRPTASTIVGSSCMSRRFCESSSSIGRSDHRLAAHKEDECTKIQVQTCELLCTAQLEMEERKIM